MELEGKLKVIGDTQTIGNNGFEKREFVITTEEQYPQHVQLEFIQGKCSLLDNYEIGQKVKVAINIRGREWVNSSGETKYFNSIQAWRIDSLEKVTPQEAFEPAEDLNEEDDLPF
ncbi:MAG: DUF3127 domain-containing protein [Bacteroidota bacterium]